MTTNSTYMYPCDTYIGVLLGSYLVRKTLQAIQKKYYQEEIDALLQEVKPATEEHYPVLFSNYQACCQKLNLTENYPLYVTDTLCGINALSLSNKEQQLILISRTAVAQLTEAELRFVLGHELGHCQYGHMVAHTVLGLLHDMNDASEILGPLLTDMIEVPLVQWFHCSEFTADRAGLICCGSLEVARQIFLQLGLEREVSAYDQLQELSSPHPLLQTRWQMLTQFAQTL